MSTSVSQLQKLPLGSRQQASPAQQQRVRPGAVPGRLPVLWDTSGRRWGASPGRCRALPGTRAITPTPVLAHCRWHGPGRWRCAPPSSGRPTPGSVWSSLACAFPQCCRCLRWRVGLGWRPAGVWGGAGRPVRTRHAPCSGGARPCRSSGKTSGQPTLAQPGRSSTALTAAARFLLLLLPCGAGAWHPCLAMRSSPSTTSCWTA